MATGFRTITGNSTTSWWGANVSNKAVFLGYSFETQFSSFRSSTGDNKGSFQQLSDADKTLARDALKQWADVSGITFFEVPAGRGDLKFMKFDFTGSTNASAAGFAYYPGVELGFGYQADIGGEIFINSTTRADLNLYLHEVGHALGFKHSFDGDPKLDANLDNGNQTVMSYTGPRTGKLGPLDVQAVQYLYGTADRDGSQVAGWSFAGGNLTQTGTAGPDQIRGLKTNDVINGGAGDDLIAAFRGNDVIDGGAGNDEIYGGEENDTITTGFGTNEVFAGAGTDTVRYAGTRAEYAITKFGSSMTVKKAGISDTLYDIEYLRFDDMTLDANLSSVRNEQHVYRFWNKANGDHFYTTSADEKASIQANLPNMIYEGALFDTPVKSANTIDVHRFYKTDGTHFYTTNLVEKDAIVATLKNYTYEGVAFQAYSNASSPDAIVLQRFYRPSTGEHHFAASAAEAQGLRNQNWGNDEGPGLIMAKVSGPVPGQSFGTEADDIAAGLHLADLFGDDEHTHTHSGGLYEHEHDFAALMQVAPVPDPSEWR